jgi:hypothetical protein
MAEPEQLIAAKCKIGGAAPNLSNQTLVFSAVGISKQLEDWQASKPQWKNNA